MSARRPRLAGAALATLFCTAGWLVPAPPARAGGGQAMAPAGQSSTPGGPLEEGRDWDLYLTPTAWGAEAGGFVSLGREAVELNVPFDSIFDLEVGYGLEAEVWWDRWGALSTLVALDYGPDVIGIQPTPDDDPIAVGSELELTAVDIAVGWRIRNQLGLVVGVRRLDVDAAATVSGSPVPAASHDWVDPIVGLVGRSALGTRWAYNWRLDVGGFGVESDLTVFSAVALELELSETWGLQLGYRTLIVDYADDGSVFALDATFDGVSAAVAFHLR